MILQCNKVKKSYGSHTVVEDLDLAIKEKEFVALLGPSGCGKTTILNMIAGFEEVETGAIILGGAEISNPKLHLPPEKRGIGMVFQDFALFPHLSLIENIGFGLSREGREKRAFEMLKLVGLEKYAHALPHQISGGQQQRVAVARALAPKPKLILLDEPFSSLDTSLRSSLREELKKILKEQGATVILVTHDQEEAFLFADRIVMMQDGKITQKGTPEEVYLNPATPWVANFVGESNFLPANFVKEKLSYLFKGKECIKCSENCSTMIRPENVIIKPAGQKQGAAMVLGSEFLGSQQRVKLQVWEGHEMTSLCDTRQVYKAGDLVDVEMLHFHCFHQC